MNPPARVIRIAHSAITWPREAPLEQVIAEIAGAGYEGTPVGPWGGRSARETAAMCARHGLAPAPGYLGAAFWDADHHDAILERARESGRFMQEAGCTELFVAAQGFDYVTRRGRTRSQAAAKVLADDAMSDAEFRQFARTLNEVGEITLQVGVRSCFHNHVGSTIETGGEIDRLFSLVDRTLVFQGPDIGHLAWGGVDPVDFCRRYADSIRAVHLKDIDPAVLREGVERGWDYRTFSDRGIFAEPGEGMVDVPAIRDVLQNAGFSGWLIVETDATRKATPLESAAVSRRYLAGIGL